MSCDIIRSHIIHALGNPVRGSKKAYRNYYCTDRDDSDCLKAVELGYMIQKPDPLADARFSYFFVTQAGAEFAMGPGYKLPKELDPSRNAGRFS